jgi:MFS family permease
MLASDLVGRRRVLGAVLTLLGLGQVLLAVGALIPGAILAGLGGGAFYPLIASLVREFFGEERTAEIQGVVYSTKAVAGILGVAAVAVAGFAVMAVPALLAALATLRLRKPGRPVTLPL